MYKNKIMSNYTWKIKHFSEITTLELYNLIQLREKVFVVEQDCPYLDVDGKDLDAYHIFCVNQNDAILATSRILKPGVSYPETSIGRVCVAQEARKNKLGKEMMLLCIEFIQNKMQHNEIRLSAQTYLTQFYKDLGFEPIGEIYLEDNIPHIEMYFAS